MTATVQFFEDWKEDDDGKFVPIWNTKVGFTVDHDDQRDKDIAHAMKLFGEDLDNGSVEDGEVFLVAMRVTKAGKGDQRRNSESRRRHRPNGDVTERSPTADDMPDL